MVESTSQIQNNVPIKRIRTKLGISARISKTARKLSRISPKIRKTSSTLVRSSPKPASKTEATVSNVVNADQIPTMNPIKQQLVKQNIYKTIKKSPLKGIPTKRIIQKSKVISIKK